MQFIFAHAGELHETAAQDSAHIIFGQWYTSLLFLFVLIFLIAKLTSVVTRGSKAATYNAVLVTLFVTGVIGYKYSPVMAIVSIGAGFAMALLQVLLDLTSKPD